MRMKEIEDAVGFMRTQYRDAVTKFGFDSPQALQLKAPGSLLQQAMSPLCVTRTTGFCAWLPQSLETVVPKRWAPTYRRLTLASSPSLRNKMHRLLEKMGIMGDLRDAAHASNLFTQVAKETSALSSTANNQSCICQVVDCRKPHQDYLGQLERPLPRQEHRAFVELAKKAAADALEGLKSSLLRLRLHEGGGNRLNPTQSSALMPTRRRCLSRSARNQPSL
jgi:hypothetical protein